VAVRYETELRELHRAGVIDDATAARAIAIDRGAVFSVFQELRVALYAAVALITSGIGIFIKQNLDRIGPITIIATLALFAAFCYAGPIKAKLRGVERSLGGDYLLLLGALLLSADIAYAESQFHWLNGNWSWHLLILAAVHGITAYLLDSRLVFSVALASFAGWFGLEQNALDVFGSRDRAQSFGWRALICAAIIFGLRIAHERSRSSQRFAEVYEHFAANLAFWAALAWCADESMRLIGALLVTALAVTSVFKGLRNRQEMFVVYGVGYAAIGYCTIAGSLISSVLMSSVIVLLLVIGAAAVLWRLHGQLKEAGG
jgi:hypothetical protein